LPALLALLVLIFEIARVPSPLTFPFVLTCFTCFTRAFLGKRAVRGARVPCRRPAELPGQVK
jgi:hypothetical protein